MDQQGHKTNDDIFFCEDCWFRLVLKGSNFKCGRTGKSLRFYDRACDEFRYSQPETRKYEYDPQRNAYIVK